MTFEVSILEDDMFEGTEDFLIRIEPPLRGSGVTDIGLDFKTDSAHIFIVDNDSELFEYPLPWGGRGGDIDLLGTHQILCSPPPACPLVNNT